MEIVFCITRSFRRDFLGVLRSEVRLLRRERLRCRLGEAGNGVFRFKVLPQNQNDERYLRLRLARVVGDFLSRYLLESRTAGLLRRRGYSGSRIAEVVKQRLAQEQALLSPVAAAVGQVVREYVKEANWVDLQGLLHFRLRQIDPLVNQIVWQVADDILFEEEWREFISYLRSFRRRRLNGNRSVHCLGTAADSFLLCDGRGRALKMIPVPPSDAWDHEDLLIGSLIEMGAVKVTFHRYTPSPPATKILHAIFRVRLCSGCRFCRGKRSK